MSKYHIVINGVDYEVEIQEEGSNNARVLVNGVCYDVELRSSVKIPRPKANPNSPVEEKPPPLPQAQPKPNSSNSAPSAEAGILRAPMPGVVLEVKVKVGDKVKQGDVVIRIEAMKMENDITATEDGVVKEIRVKKGSQVQENAILLVLGD